jgi:hypothetical protein
LPNHLGCARNLYGIIQLCLCRLSIQADPVGQVRGIDILNRVRSGHPFAANQILANIHCDNPFKTRPFKSKDVKIRQEMTSIKSKLLLLISK